MSPNTQRVMVVLAEKGLKYELKQIRVMESEHKVRKAQDYSPVDFAFF
jgi:glutathione S-transferase